MGRRSLLYWIFGTVFSNDRSTSRLIAVVLLMLVVYLYARQATVPDPLMNVLMLVMGYYFRGTQKAA